MSRNAYKRFFERKLISKEEFFQFGLEECILIEYSKAEVEWNLLKKRFGAKQALPLRDFGRNGNGNGLLSELYLGALGVTELEFDRSNNSHPRKVLERLTGYSKKPNKSQMKVENYQVSHAFGRTKNILAFTAPWNIVYIPKLLDPLTGHESVGIEVVEFTIRFRAMVYDHFKYLIDDFNNMMESEQIQQSLNSYFERAKGNNLDKDLDKIKKIFSEDFAPIEVQSFLSKKAS